MRDLEHQIQSGFFEWLERFAPAIRPFVFAIPNGGVRNIRTAVRLKKEGVTAGTPDVFAGLPHGKSLGVFIEFKAGKNKLTDKQKDFMLRFSNVGYDCVTCYSIDEAIAEIKKRVNKSMIKCST